MTTNIVPATIARLGFGCAQLFRLHSAREREAALHAAYDAGIRHFDVAPLYGLGLAEAELGRFLSTRRDGATVTTKFGLDAAVGVSALRSIQGMVRRVVNAVPPVKRYLQGRRRPLVGNQFFDAKSAERSLARSLRLLRVDFIDYFLLHEPTVLLVDRDRPMDFLQLQRDRGRIRGFGVAGPLDLVSPVCARFPTLSSVIQYPAPPVGSPPVTLESENMSESFVYGSIASRITAITARIKSSGAANDAWAARFGNHARQWHQKLARILLLEQRVVAPSSTILFGSTEPAHVREIARLPSSEELAAVGWLRDWTNAKA